MAIVDSNISVNDAQEAVSWRHFHNGIEPIDGNITLAALDIPQSAIAGADGKPISVNGALGSLYENKADAIPGTIIYTAGQAAPSGYLKANGAAISRTTYAALFSVIGTIYGVGNGSTTFNVPDLRGEFLRGWSDGRSVDSGRTLGSAQGFAMQNITGSFRIRTGYQELQVDVVSGAFTRDLSGTILTGAGLDAAPVEYTRVNLNASNQVTTAAETRPRNIAMLACIKY